MGCKTIRIHQTDCFKTNFKFWKFLGIWPGRDMSKNYKYYSTIFVTFLIITFDSIITVNFAFLPRQMDIIIEELIFYTTELGVVFKVMTYLIMKDKIMQLMDALNSEAFQPRSKKALSIIEKAMKFNKTYYKIVAYVSFSSNIIHLLSPLFFHIFFHVELFLPVSTYCLFSEEFRKRFIYPLYFYQSFGMHVHMLCNINIDTFILGVLIFVIAQLDILYYDLCNVTDEIKGDGTHRGKNVSGNDDHLVHKLNKCIIHYDEVNKFCILLQDIFSVVLFIQFSLASSVICVCLFRFTLPAPGQYYIFLSTYMTIMILQILVPCWFGTRVMYKSSLLALAAYECDWTPRSRRFKSNLRLFVERANRPLSVVGGKMFPLSLTTFSSIMNSAYSFFTLLRHMQTREAELN